jgi:hypothetical protein
MKKLKIYIIILAIILIVTVAGFFLLNRGIEITAKDPRSIALSLSDISNIPDGLIFNLSSSVAIYKTGNYWPNETQRQIVLAKGFTNGYYDFFVYQTPSSLANVKVIGSSVSIFNQSAQEILNEDIHSYTNDYDNCISFNFSVIGDGSFGCQMVLNVSNIEMSYTNIFFYKNNIVVRTFIGQAGIVDLNNETIQYANIIANRTG